jgi:hypothetical protein
VVDLRALDEAFLPGKLHFSSPAALCVHDRRTEGRLAAVVLMPGAGARVLRLKACLGASAVEEPLPPVATRPSALEFGGNVVPLPTLSQVLATATSPAGFVVADALDSQRLWVITASS